MKARNVTMIAAALLGAQPVAAQSLGNGAAQGRGDWMSRLQQMQQAQPQRYPSQPQSQAQPWQRSGPSGSVRSRSYYRPDGNIVAQCISSPVTAAVIAVGEAPSGNSQVLIIPERSLRVGGNGYNVGQNFAYRSRIYTPNYDQRAYDDALAASASGYTTDWFRKASRNYEVPFLAELDQYGALLIQEGLRRPAPPELIDQALAPVVPAQRGSAIGRGVNASATACFGPR